MQTIATYIIDVGTSSMRGILFDNNANMLKKIQYKFALKFGEDGTVEQDANSILQYLIDITEQIGLYIKENNIVLNSIAITGQRASLIAVDKNGYPLRSIITWQDKRTIPICNELKPIEKEIYSICGMKPIYIYSASKMKWFSENEKHLYDKAHKIFGFLEFLTYHITSEFCVDTSVASRICLLDIKSLKWSDRLLKIFNMDKEKLCNIIDVGGIAGETNKKFNTLLHLNKPIPVILAGGDQQCAAIGLGQLDSSSIRVNCGTGAYVIGLSDEPKLDEQMRFVCNVSAIKDKWIMEGTALSSGSSINWLNRELFESNDEKSDFENFNESCRISPIGANGLIAITSFLGKGTPSWDSYAKGSFFNATLSNKKGDFARALLEGIVADIYSNVELILKSIGDPSNKKCRCSGGLTKLGLFNQIQADIYKMPVIYSNNTEATSYGVWMQAMVGLGICQTHKEAYDMINKDDGLKFMPNKENSDLYDRIDLVRKYYENAVDNKKIYDILNDSK